MKALNNAKQIKALFIDLMLENQEDELVIGNEIMFADKKAIADLVFLENGLINAYEVKSHSDDLRKLEYQLNEYNKVFDHVSVILTENHLNKAKEIIPRKNGIIVLNANYEFKVVRKSVKNNRLNKEELLSTMTIKFIRSYFNLPSSNLNAFEIRKSLSNKSLTELKAALHQFLFDRISSKFEIFKDERGVKTHFEDITLLSMNGKKVEL